MYQSIYTTEQMITHNLQHLNRLISHSDKNIQNRTNTHITNISRNKGGKSLKMQYLEAKREWNC